MNRFFSLAMLAAMPLAGVFANILLCSQGASAAGGDSLTDIISNYQSRTAQLQSNLTNPLGGDCEGSNPDSSINCNETADSPSTLLFNRISNGEKLWGHDGKGTIFADSENLVNGNPQFKTAERGDTLKFSIAIEAENYYDDEKTDPITGYMFGSLNSCGLAVDKSSAIVKVNNQVVSADAYNVEFYDIPKEEAERAGYDFCNEFIISLDWVNESDTLLYAEGSTIEFTYEATIEDDAPSEVFGRGVYVYRSKSGHQEFSSTNFMTDTTYQATALLDGNILIRRVDANSNPLEGAKYTVDGVKANQGDNGTYVYDKNGQIDEFVTDERGQVVILGVPFGEYAVTEISSPDGSTPQERKIIKSLAANIENSVVSQTTGFEVPEVEVAFGMRMGLLSATAIKDGLWMVKIPGETMDVSLNYNSQENCWIGTESNEEVKVCRGADGQLYAAQGTMDIPSDRPLIYNPDNDTYFLTVSGPDLHYYQMQIIKTDDTTITLKVGSEQFILQRDSANDCFHVDLTEVIGNSRTTVDPDSTICTTDADTYDLSYTVNYDQGSFVRNEHFEKLIVTDELLNDASFDPTLQYYVSDYPFMALSFRLDSNNTMAASLGFPISYVAPYNKYFLALAAPSPAQLEAKYQTIDNYQYVTPFLFRPSTNTDSPEDISNPQTGDAVLKAVIIVAIGLAPVVILRRQLTKRSH